MPRGSSYNVQVSRPYTRRKAKKPIWQEGSKVPQSMTSKQMQMYNFRNVNMLKGLVNVERKLYSLQLSDAITNAAAIIHPISNVSAGDDINTRNGNSILAKTLQIRSTFTYPHVGAGFTGAYVRFLVVKDTMQTGSDPQVTEILQSGTYLAPILDDAVSRFQVVIDEIIPLSPSGENTIQRKYFRNLNFHIKYFGTSSNSEYKNNMFLLLLTNSASQSVLVENYVRLSFYDN